MRGERCEPLPFSSSGGGGDEPLESVLVTDELEAVLRVESGEWLSRDEHCAKCRGVGADRHVRGGRFAAGDRESAVASVDGEHVIAEFYTVDGWGSAPPSRSEMGFEG